MHQQSVPVCSSWPATSFSLSRLVLLARACVRRTCCNGDLCQFSCFCLNCCVKTGGVLKCAASRQYRRRHCFVRQGRPAAAASCDGSWNVSDRSGAESVGTTRHSACSLPSEQLLLWRQSAACQTRHATGRQGKHAASACLNQGMASAYPAELALQEAKSRLLWHASHAVQSCTLSTSNHAMRQPGIMLMPHSFSPQSLGLTACIGGCHY